MKFKTKDEAEDYVRRQNAWAQINKKEPKKMEVVEAKDNFGDVFEVKED